jgi:hypothetical protein
LEIIMATSVERSYRVRPDFSGRTVPGILLGVGLIATLGGCANKQRLPQYDFRNRTIGVVSIAPARPEILSGVARTPGSDDPVERAIAIGSAIVMEVSARQALPRMETAAATVNVKDRMGDRVLESAARHLRAIPVASAGGADFEIEIRIHRYGITASSWRSDAEFLLDAELFLLDGATGRRIWKSRVSETSPVRALLASGDPAVDGAVSAIALSNMSTEEIQRQLESLADFSADHLVAELVRALDRTRG